MARDRLSISWDELKSETVEKKLQQQEAISQVRLHYDSARVVSAPQRRSKIAWVYNTAVYMTIFGLLGGLLGWGFGILLHLRPNAQHQARDLIATYNEASRQLDTGLLKKELFDAQARGLKREGRDNEYFQLFIKHHNGEMNDAEFDTQQAILVKRDTGKDFIADLLFYGVAGLMIAACLGMAESVVERNVQGALILGTVGAVAGLVGGLVVSLFAERIFAAVAGGQTDAEPWRVMLARACQWGVLGLFLSLAPGLLLRNVKKLLIGLIAGLAGGIAGGVLFEPTKTVAEQFIDNGDVLSRLVGLLAIGGVAGMGTGLIENAVKSGWFKVVNGLIAGKQFVLYRNPTYIGSSPQCHIYLFKDPQVGKRHAAVHVLAQGFELEDLPLGSRTLVNGRPISRTMLKNGDQVQVGSTAFVFQAKAKTV